MVATGDSRLGATIGNCRLLSVLGAGSTSTVYLAQPLDDPRGPVALKVLHPHLLGETDDYTTFRKRFEREALAASQLQNEHIVPVLDYGETDGTPYMVMPLIDGGTLADRLAQAQQANAPLPLREAEGYITQLASALDVAHNQGMVHRDVKPSNILLDRLGRIYLTDFGIARLFNDSRMTKTGQVVGTPYYMAPEQASGDRPVTKAADIYSLGVVAYQMVTGQVPFHADTPMIVLVQHIQETPRPPSELRGDLPKALEQVILRALAKDPDERYTTAGEFARAFSGGCADTAAPEDPAPTTQTWRAKSFVAPVPIGAPSPAVNSTAQPDQSYETLVGTQLREYRLERMISSDELGAIYVARPDAFTAPRWLRVRRLPADLTPSERIEYLDHFSKGAEDLVALRHPNLLQVLEYGSDRDLVYLVMPEVTSDSLRAVLKTSGALEPGRTGAYVDQIADALDCADDEGILHLNLTADCVYVDNAGHLLVADCGTRNLILPAMATHEQTPLYVTSEVCSPEQLTGKLVGAYTDVYALGALMYFMLEGHPVFEGKTADDVAQQHMHSAVPKLRKQRPDTPLTLNTVLATALDKEPSQRYQAAGELARAYRTALLGTSSARPNSAAVNGGSAPVAALIEPTGNAPSDGAATRQTQLVAASSLSTPAPSTSTSSSSSPAESSIRVRRSAVRSRLTQTSQPARSAIRSTAAPARSLPVIQPPKQGPARPVRSNRRWLLWAGSVVGLVALIGGTIALIHQFGGSQGTTPPVSPYAHATASVNFFDSTPGNLRTDALSVQATGLPALRGTSQYDVWFYAESSEQPLLLGSLTNDGGTWKLAYPSATNGAGQQPGGNVLSLGNTIRITLESATVQSPIGPTVLTGTFGPSEFTHIKHLLVAFPTNPDQKPYLVGMLQQLRTLQDQVNAMKSFVGSQHYISARCSGQNALDLTEGPSGPHFTTLGSECTGRNIAAVDDRLGLLGKDGWVSGASDHASFAIQSGDASAYVKMHAPHVVIACTDITGWLNTVDKDLATLISTNSFDQSAINQVTVLVDHAINGVALNGDEVPGPVQGEAGGVIAFEHGQKMSQLDLAPAR